MPKGWRDQERIWMRVYPQLQVTFSRMLWYHEYQEPWLSVAEESQIESALLGILAGGHGVHLLKDVALGDLTQRWNVIARMAELTGLRWPGNTGTPERVPPVKIPEE